MLPQLAAQSLRDKNSEPFVVALKSFTDTSWVGNYAHVWLRLGQVGKLVKTLKKQGVEQITFAGHLRRPSLSNFVSQYGLDMQGAKLLWQLRKKSMGDDTLLRHVADFFNKKGFAIVGTDQIIPDSLMPSGALTQKNPDVDEWRDIDAAAKILKEWARLDQGQAIVVQQGIILGVEAAEGTDELIRRCAAYKREGRGPILVKIKKPQQDRRLDLPTIGEKTVKSAIEAGFSGIAVQAGNALFLNPSGSVALANENKIFLVGFDL